MRILRFVASLLTAFSLAAVPAVAATAAVPEAPAKQYSYDLGIAPRLQWNANYGYCGEVSFISAGMYYGQYTSQWTARSLASPGISQTKEESQLLVGVNDVAAAEQMRLEAVPFDSESQRSTRAMHGSEVARSINGAYLDRATGRASVRAMRRVVDTHMKLPVLVGFRRSCVDGQYQCLQSGTR